MVCSRRFFTKSARTIRQALFVAALAGLWELAARAGRLPALLFPPFSDVAVALAAETASGEILGRLTFSLAMVGAGLCLATLSAVIVTAASMSAQIVSEWVQALMAILHPLPGIAILPVVILWLGTGNTSIVAVIWFSAMWPLVANLHTGLRSVPATQIEVGRNLGLRGARLVAHVLIPGAFPHILSGMRVAWARAWQALVAAEMVFGASGGEGGLGWFIYKRRFFMEIPGVFAGMVVIVLVGIVVERVVFESVEARTVRRWGMTAE
ncbi:MAG: ABC transporter permease subunit [Firmicutes bacterium]|jgi:NitT/TauT family transport system permease protein|nr:ABC transporter permease subunit [Bacillota bacterium]MDH7496318.1 ABC transporter permease subunit [Bacillota bacterium]